MSSAWRASGGSFLVKRLTAGVTSNVNMPSGDHFWWNEFNVDSELVWPIGFNFFRQSTVRPLTFAWSNVGATNIAWPDEGATSLPNLFLRILELDLSTAQIDFGGWYSRANGIVMSLRRLKQGWAGEGSVAPSDTVCRDIETVSGYLPSGTKQPEVEVDETTGTVTLVWPRSDYSSTFSLVFTGAASVMGILLGSEASQSWKHPVYQEATIARALEVPGVHRLLIGK